MKIKSIITVLLVAFILASCAPVAKVVPTETTVPTSIFTPVPPTPTVTPTSILTLDDIRAIIYASNPESPQYDPKSAIYAEFPEAVKQLSTMGSNGVEAAGDLAGAINFPRQDSYLAAQALITLGTDITSTTIATLFSNLDSSYYPNQKPEALIYSIILLSTTGNRASCAVGNIGPLLWNSDSRVRSAAAFALDIITEQDLITSQYEIEISPSFMANSIFADEPEGSIAGTARQWWNKQGSKVKWHSSYGPCDP
jgi:hypothetical protein